MKKIFLILISIINIFFVIEVESKNKTSPYDIKKINCRAPYECSYDIIIDSKYSKEELTAIAYELKSDSPEVKRTFISYYLSCMEIDKGAWATINFQPNLSIDIYDTVLDLFPECSKFKRKNKIAKKLNVKIAKKLNVKMTLKSEFKNGKLYIKGKTNLPDYTDIYSNVSKNGFTYFSNHTTIQVGEFEVVAYHASFYQEDRLLPNGKYIIEVGTILAELMDKSVQEILGSNGENMTGKLITKQAAGDGKVVKFILNHTITTSFNKKNDSTLLRKELKIFKNHYNKLKKICCGKSSLDAKGIDWAVKGVEWVREREKLNDAFDKKFGRNFKEYNGLCQMAFLNISEFSHYTFTLYQKMYGYSDTKRAKYMKFWEKRIKETISNFEAELKKCRKY